VSSVCGRPPSVKFTTEIFVLIIDTLLYVKIINTDYLKFS